MNPEILAILGKLGRDLDEHARKIERTLDETLATLARGRGEIDHRGNGQPRGDKQ